MLLAGLLISLLYVTGQCQNIQYIPSNQNDNIEIIKCVTEILNKYFAEDKELTYVNMNPEDDTLLKAIHLLTNISVIYRQATHPMSVLNRGYLINSVNVANFTKYFEYLIREPMWNPYARFLIVIRTMQDNELKIIFDVLLKLHVINVLVMNGTDGGDLYTYNPFGRHACGRSYNSVINYGLCSQPHKNLFPMKLVTGFKKCNFRALIVHRPPFSFDPTRTKNKRNLFGLEEFIITQLGKTENFTISFNYRTDDIFSTVAANMTAFGPMKMLQENEYDIMFGGMEMATARAEAFTYLCGYHDYSDELRFAVKRSPFASSWRYIYLEFELDVWALLFVTFVVFSILMTILLHSKDRGAVVLRLLDCLLLHGRHVRTRFVVNCILITWVWFAYLINTFYQSNLFSFTTHPNVAYQVADEEYLIEYDFEACFSPALRNFLSTDAISLSKTGYFREEGCQTTAQAMRTVSTTEDTFTLVPNYFYLYNERKYRDAWGNSLVYYFHKPYTKFLFGYFFYKGFPITKRLQLNTLRMRESGLVDKNLHDHYYGQKIKQNLLRKPFETHFLFPWCISVAGFVIGTIVFLLEILIKYTMMC